MRKTNNGAPPSLRQQGRSLRTSYGAWALDAAAEEVMDEPPALMPLPSRETISEAALATTRRLSKG